MSRIAKCARCGRYERSGDTFLCSSCLEDPKQRREISIVTNTAGDYRDWRRRLKAEFHWFGWGPTRTERS